MNAARTLLFSLLVATAHAATWTDYFTFENVPNPPGIDPQVGAMDTLPDGKIAVAFHRGEVMIYDPAARSWTPFASGLQEPLGLLAQPDGSLLVMQRAELTRLADTDQDHRADLYETLFDGFGMSGNYHEFNYGPARDRDGNLFIALGLASNGAPIRKEIRGEFSKIGLTREKLTEGTDWSRYSDLAGRMYSRVSYRGWVIKLSPDGKSPSPWACGFRSPNGIGFDAAGRLLVTDNQGDWLPTSPLHQVQKDGFYGNPASLVWQPDWDGRAPLEVPVAELEALRTQPSGYFPHGELANSPTQPVIIPDGAFPAAFNRQTLIGEMNQPTLIRILDDEANGKFQPGLVQFLTGPELGIGNHRLTFGKDGALYVGKTALSWPGSFGIKRIQWNGKPFFAIDALKATPSGFILTLSARADPASLPGLTAQRHTYHYHATYGSPKLDESTLPVRASLSADGKILTLDLGTLKEKHLHFLNLEKLRSTTNFSLLGDKVWYQTSHLPQ